jgi:subtilisin family serine protease
MKNFQIKKTLSMNLIILLVVLTLAVKGHPLENENQKKKITSIDQLPRQTYKIPGTIIEMINDEKAFTAFAHQVRQDIENQLNTYDIQDKDTLGEYYGTLLTLDLLQGNHDAVLKGVQRMRELVDKPAAKLMTALTEETITLARQQTKATAGDQYKKTFAGILAEKVGKFPWNTIQESIIGLKGAMDIYSKNLLLGLVQSTLEPALKRSGYISSDMAHQIIGICFVLKEVIPIKEQIINVYGKLIKKNRVEKPDIWKEREIDLDKERNLSPVIVAIWDTGVDTTVFPGRLFTNPNEIPDGKDNDGNGFVDDIHGIAYTLEAEKTTELLYSMEGKSRLISSKDKIELLKGFIDMQNALESPEAAALKKRITAMKPGQVKSFIENLMQLLLHIHGTHVGGIAIAGNPFARILTVRSSFDYRVIPKPITMEITSKNVEMYKSVVTYLKENGARVVNISWSFSLKELEKNLEANGIGKDAKERGNLARQMFDVLKNGFYKAIKNAPEILFINSAGNEDNDPLFQEYIPTSFDLPNVMAVGAVDQAGDETVFTSSGKVVDVYANGYNVESFLPGGQRMPASGTSMSAPQVSNLAAKLLTLSPRLKIAELVELIKKGADKSEDGRILLINPRRSVQLLKSKQKNSMPH